MSEARDWVLSGVLRVSQYRRLLRMYGSEALLQIQDAMCHLGDVKGPKKKRGGIEKSGDRGTKMIMPQGHDASQEVIRQN